MYTYYVYLFNFYVTYEQERKFYFIHETQKLSSETPRDVRFVS